MSWIAVLVIIVAIVVLSVAYKIMNIRERELGGVLDENEQFIKDPDRMFLAYEVDEAKRRCGYRCEYVTFFGRRCKNKAGKLVGGKPVVLHADHWIPWSRGGASNADNLVMLCSHCNLAKSNTMPFIWETSRLYKSRLAYQINAIRPGARYGSSPRAESWFDTRIQKTNTINASDVIDVDDLVQHDRSVYDEYERFENPAADSDSDQSPMSDRRDDV